jgi:hypothetical protein
MHAGYKRRTGATTPKSTQGGEDDGGTPLASPRHLPRRAWAAAYSRWRAQRPRKVPRRRHLRSRSTTRRTASRQARLQKHAGRPVDDAGASWHPGRAHKGVEKKNCCVTTRHGNFRLFQHLRRRWDTPTARTLSLGMLGLDPFVLSTPRLPPRRLPAADLAQALRILAVTLIPTPGLILAPTAFAQTHPRPRSPRTSTWAASWITMMTTHGRSLSPKGQPEGNARTFSSGAINHHAHGLASLYARGEPDRERNNLRNAS